MANPLTRSNHLSAAVAGISYSQDGSLYAMHRRMHRTEEEVTRGEEIGSDCIVFDRSLAGRVLAAVDKIPEGGAEYLVKCPFLGMSFKCSSLLSTSNENCRVLPQGTLKERIFIVKWLHSREAFTLRYKDVLSITVICRFCDADKKIKEALLTVGGLYEACSQLVLEYMY